MRHVGYCEWHVAVVDGAHFCGGQTDERAASASPRTVLGLKKYNIADLSFDIGSAVNSKWGKRGFNL